MDTDLVKRCIKNVLESDSNSEIFCDWNSPKDPKLISNKLLSLDSKIYKSKHIRSFELILRMIFAACLIKDKKQGAEKNAINLIKNVACHFTLLYICKNGKLVNRVDDNFSKEELDMLLSDGIKVGSDSFLRSSLCELNPLIFIDILCEFLHENNQNVAIGSKIVLNEIFELLKKFYPTEEEYDIALSRMEFVDIMFKKICNIAY
jgi:hypothetical protein